MNHERYLTHQPSKTCPICQTKYRPSKGYTSPTCGNPNCIREARERGLPFASQPIHPEEKPVIAKKATTGKSRKRKT